MRVHSLIRVDTSRKSLNFSDDVQWQELLHPSGCSDRHHGPGVHTLHALFAD